MVPDNWRSGVKQPCYYEPELNRTYEDLAVHSGVGILPARPVLCRDLISKNLFQNALLMGHMEYIVAQGI